MNTRGSISIGRWTLILGAVGFACGFLGPIALNPDANQGPLLGIFITGPGGALLGLTLGIIFKLVRVEPNKQLIIMVGACILGAFTVLYFCLPEPELQGHVVKGTITQCSLPQTQIDAAVKDWQKRLADAPWAAPRAHWQEDVPRMLTSEGVIITLQPREVYDLRKLRKPWNRGRLEMSRGTPSAQSTTYFANYAGSNCDEYSKETELLYISGGQGSTEWPPSDLLNFLNFALIEPLPIRYRALLPQ